jgi:hypothetical protein
MRTLAAALILALAAPALAADPLAPAAAPSAATPASVAPAAPERAPGYGKTEGFLPGILIGPKLSILSIPNPSIGLEAKLLQNKLGLSIDYDLIPSVKMMDVSVGYRDLNFGVKFYPWQRSFFIGAALGSRAFWAKATEATTQLEVKAEVSTTYLAPEIGWRFVWDGGFFMGLDLGYQIVLSSDVTLHAGTSTESVDVNDAADDLGKIGFPVITLLQIGYFF